MIEDNEDSTKDIHVIPLHDLHEHVESRYCRCHPNIQQEPMYHEAVVVHNSADGRECVEEHGLQ